MLPLNLAGSPQTTTNIGIRSYLSCFWIFTITIVAAFSGNLMAFMTVTKLKPDINTLYELAEDSGYQAAIPRGGAVQLIFEVN